MASSTANRAVDRAAAGDKALAAAELTSALAAFTEACHLDPSFAAARLGLARTYVAAGQGTVAIELLEAMVEKIDDCGPCLEALIAYRDDPAFSTIREHSRGAGIAEAVAGRTLPFGRWASELAAALATPAPATLKRYAHIKVPFLLSRVCPDCQNRERRTAEERALTGFMLLVKVASRFDLSNPMMGGIALSNSGEPKCARRCCGFADEGPVPPGTARLLTLCFRPLTAATAALTRVELAYGPTAERAQPVPADAPTPAEAASTAPKTPSAPSPSLSN